MSPEAWISLVIIALVLLPILIGFCIRPPGRPHDDERHDNGNR
jgi:hypothetical protein